MPRVAAGSLYKLLPLERHGPVLITGLSTPREVEVWAERSNEMKCELVTHGSLTMVSVDADGHPIPWSTPSTLTPGDPS